MSDSLSEILTTLKSVGRLPLTSMVLGFHPVFPTPVKYKPQFSPQGKEVFLHFMIVDAYSASYRVSIDPSQAGVSLLRNQIEDGITVLCFPIFLCSFLTALSLGQDQMRCSSDSHTLYPF